MNQQEFARLKKTTKHLKRTDAMSVWWVIRATLVSALWIALLCHGSTWAWVLGSILHLAVIFNWVSILHECGHGNFFKKRWLNTAVGVFASVGSLMPYEQWRVAHNLHHRWTGYIDLDPTASGDNETVIQQSQKTIVDIAWKYWIPIFIPAFYIRTFWNPSFSFKLAKTYRDKAFHIFCLVFMFTPYVTFTLLFGWEFIITIFPGIFFTIWFADPFLLSQHVHMPRFFSSDVEGTPRPVPLREQDQYTREVTFPKFISDLVFMNFNYHVAHHYFPNLPAYHLGKLDYETPTRMRFVDWIRRSKQLPGHVLLLEVGDF
ncbi:MAG: fatty acid desaturase [Myxococcota bacterium]|nr:fatty acid desaturase [Myxococcota bacterium]